MKKRIGYLVHGASYANISRESAEMIRVMTNSPIKISKKEESVDMCKALEQMMYDARTEGKAEGEAKGRTEGILSTLSDLVKNGIITLEQAANQAKMSVNEFESKAGLHAV